MMDSLDCKPLIGKAIISHTAGGIAAGMAAHWLYILFTMIRMVENEENITAEFGSTMS